MSHHVVERKIGNQTLRIETGKLAKQAAGSVLVTLDEAVVFVGVVTGKPREGIDFFPLTVDYREKTYAAGKFPGGFFKREARPTQKEILTMRMIDRPARPLFPKGFKDEVLIQAMALATDGDIDPDILAMIGASAALSVSSIPFNGPIASCRVGYVDDEFVLNPGHAQLEYSTMEMVLAGHKDAINMIEVGSMEVSEQVISDGVAFGHKFVIEVCEMIDELTAKAGKEKLWTPPPSTEALRGEIAAKYTKDLRKARMVSGKQDRYAAVRAVYDAVKEAYTSEETGEVVEPGWSVIREIVDEIEGEIIAERVVKDGIRSDGRSATDIRQIDCEVGVLPRVHGSSLFQRGETQALCVVTLGTGRDEQIVDGLMDEYSKKFMLHYNFPPICTGEVKRIGVTSRREIGHGNLAEKSLQAILPTPDKFPYTIRLVAEIMESNGSSSMASVCGGCLALMDAGVPIRQPVAGISIGMFEHNGESTLVVDILGEEDHFGAMDFKVAGTQRGVTGVQLDLKGRGLAADKIVETLALAKKARMSILKSMLTVLSKPRATTSEWAPRILTIKINPEKIGRVIGPGGKAIKSIEAETKANIDINEDGTILVSCLDMKGAERAIEMIEAFTAEFKVGKIYEGTVNSIRDFGAFIELSPGQDGLCHVSELDMEYVKSVGDVVKIGDRLRVKVILVDDQGRIKLSRKAAMIEDRAAEPAPAR